MRRPRFTLRWLMLLVAIVAAPLGWWRCARLSRQYELKSWGAAREQRHYEAIAAKTEAQALVDAYLDARAQGRSLGLDIGLPAPPLQYMVDRPPPPREVARRRAAHFAALVAKYERAARYPWLPVAPDPPEPE